RLPTAPTGPGRPQEPQGHGPLRHALLRLPRLQGHRQGAQGQLPVQGPRLAPGAAVQEPVAGVPPMNPRYVPRDYQTAAIEAVFNEFKRVNSTLLVWATGVGKTEAYLQVGERHLNENPEKRVLVVAHREELITQPAKRWRRNCDEWPSIEMAELRAEG